MLKPRKNKSFNYKPRFSDSDKTSGKINTRPEDSSVSRAFKNKRKPKRSTLPILLVILGLVIAVMYYLETKLR